MLADGAGDAPLKGVWVGSTPTVVASPNSGGGVAVGWEPVWDVAACWAGGVVVVFPACLSVVVGTSAVSVVNPFCSALECHERSQNTILLVSTQVVYKALHSTERRRSQSVSHSAGGHICQLPLKQSRSTSS